MEKDKVRIYQLAKELNTTSKRLMEKLAEINIDVKNHMSLLSDEQLKALNNHIGIIPHNEKKESEKKDESKPSPQVSQPQKHIDPSVKKGPRIIRKTQIIVESENQAGDQRYNNQPKKGKKNSKDFVSVAKETSGLRAGYIRDKGYNTKDKDSQYALKQNAYNKQDKNKKNDIKDKTVTSERDTSTKNMTDTKKVNDTVSEVTEKVKDTLKNNNEKNIKDNTSAKKDAAVEKQIKQDAVINKDVLSNENTKVAEQANKSTKPTEAKPNEKRVRPAGQNTRPASTRTNNSKPTGVNSTGQRSRPSGQSARPASTRTNNSKPMGSKPTGQGTRPSGQGSRPFVKKTSDNNRPGAVKKPLDIPKAETADTNEKEILRERREYKGKDLDRFKKKDDRKDATRPAISKKSKFNPHNIILPDKKDLSKVLDDGSIYDGLYKEFGKKKKSRPKKEEPVKPKEERIITIKVPDTILVKDLAERLKKIATDVIKKLLNMGQMVTINQEIDFDTAEIIADEYGIKVDKEIQINVEEILFDDTDDNDSTLVERAPVVVVMGHVDHGKTSLLDAIREENVMDTEAGGITQHIGAYTVNIKGKDITFLDTPGHEAFTSLRARGAQVTDIAILVVAANDGLMPQTIEAINHAKAANVAIIVAINKMDVPGADPEKIKQQLTEHGLVAEEWGGDVICVEISALLKQNIEHLLEMVILTAEMLELKSNPDKQAKGTVIEAQLDKNRGAIATLLVQRGTMNIGDSIVTGTTVGRIRAMVNDKGKVIEKAGPSTPVEILGLPEVPVAGELFYVVKDERLAKQLADQRKVANREVSLKSTSIITLDDLFNQIQEGKVKDLNIIVKADVHGSAEAIKQSLEKLSNETVKVRIIHSGVGAVTESDVSLAEVANAIIIAFNVRSAGNVLEAAESSNVDLRMYRIIYEAISDVEAAMKGMLDPTFKEVVQGHAEIRQIFKVSSIGTIAGCYVTDGKITRQAPIRIVRDGIVVHEGTLESLKRFKDDAKEVMHGYECGLSIEKYNDIKEGDVIESYVMEQVVN